MGRNKRLYVGLGNPGRRYKNTHHNIGLLFVEFLRKKLGASRFKTERTFEYAEADSFIIIRPLVFMNDSGLAVKAAMTRFGAGKGNILVIHDDSDIELGKYKFSLDRGSAGHKGVESVISYLRTKNFQRLRIGSRAKNGFATPGGRLKADILATKPISRKDSVQLKNTFKKILDDLIKK